MEDLDPTTTVQYGWFIKGVGVLHSWAQLT